MARTLTACLALVTALVTLLPVPAGPMGIPGFDKLAHLVTFAVLASPLAWRFPQIWHVVALAVLAYGGMIEIVQPLVGRDASWGDLLADGAGALAGAFIASRIGHRRLRAIAAAEAPSARPKDGPEPEC